MNRVFSPGWTALGITFLMVGPSVAAAQLIGVLRSTPRIGTIGSVGLTPQPVISTTGTVPLVQYGRVTVTKGKKLAEGAQIRGDLRGRLTVAFRIRPTGVVGAWGNILHKGSHARERGPGIYFRPSSTELYVRVSGRTRWDQGFPRTRPLPLNRWTHVAVIASERRLGVYIDGKLQYRGILAEEAVGNRGPLYASSPWAAPAKAELADVRVYGYKLPGTEIAKLAAAPAPAAASRAPGGGLVGLSGVASAPVVRMASAVGIGGSGSYVKKLQQSQTPTPEFIFDGKRLDDMAGVRVTVRNAKSISITQFMTRPCSASKEVYSATFKDEKAHVVKQFWYPYYQCARVTEDNGFQVQVRIVHRNGQKTIHKSPVYRRQVFSWLGRRRYSVVNHGSTGTLSYGLVDVPGSASKMLNVDFLESGGVRYFVTLDDRILGSRPIDFSRYTARISDNFPIDRVGKKVEVLVVGRDGSVAKRWNSKGEALPWYRLHLGVRYHGVIPREAAPYGGGASVECAFSRDSHVRDPHSDRSGALRKPPAHGFYSGQVGLRPDSDWEASQRPGYAGANFIRLVSPSSTIGTLSFTMPMVVQSSKLKYKCRFGALYLPVVDRTDMILYGSGKKRKSNAGRGIAPGVELVRNVAAEGVIDLADLARKQRGARVLSAVTDVVRYEIKGRGYSGFGR